MFASAKWIITLPLLPLFRVMYPEKVVEKRMGPRPLPGFPPSH